MSGGRDLQQVWSRAAEGSEVGGGAESSGKKFSGFNLRSFVPDDPADSAHPDRESLSSQVCLY